MTEKTPGRIRDYRSPRGAALSCMDWTREAALRLLMNSVDSELAERPADLIVCNGRKAARDWDSFQKIASDLQTLGRDEMLLVESGVPQGIYGAQPNDPAVVLLNTISPKNAPASLHAGNLILFAQACAANWIYVGSQIALQPTHEILNAAKQQFGGTLGGKLVVSCGLGAISGAQPLAAAMHGAAALSIEATEDTLKRCVKSGYCDVMVNDLDEALRILKNAVRKREPASVGLLAKPSDTIPILAERGVVPDLFFPNLLGRSPANAITADETKAISELQRLGTVTVDGETFLPTASLGEDAEPLVFVALSGGAADIARADRCLLGLLPADSPTAHWITLAGKHVRFQGLPARVIWLSPAVRLQFATAINRLVEERDVQAPFAVAGIFPPPCTRLSQASRTHLDIDARRVEPLKLHDSGSIVSGELLSAVRALAAGYSWATAKTVGTVENTAADTTNEAPRAEIGEAIDLLGGVIIAAGTTDAEARIQQVFGHG